MQSSRRLLIPLAVAAALGGCAPDYSPNTYSSVAVQQASKVEQGIVVGVRQVDVSAAGTIGAATGAAAGGIAGSQASGGVGAAFGAVGGALVGGIVGSAVEKAGADTTATEYIVRKPNGDLISVTQRDATPLLLGQKVLVIDGKQARIVPDYTVAAPAPASPAAAPTAASAGVTSTVPPQPHIEATPLAPPGGARPPGVQPASSDAPAFAAPVPPPPLTPPVVAPDVPGAPTSLAPPVAVP